jgi:hypothetical protein
MALRPRELSLAGIDPSHLALFGSARWTFIFGFPGSQAMVSGGFENRQPVHSQIQHPGDAGLAHWLSAIDQIPTLA